MRLWNYLLIMALWLSLIGSVSVLAADEDPVMPEEEAPSFTSPAQAQHAANVAEASFSEQDEARVENYAAEYAESYVQQIADEYATGLGYEKGTPEYQEAYDAAYARATNPNYHNAYDSAYEEGYADGVSRITGVKLEEIERLRYEEKMGWGEIAKMYDVHPGVLGLGHAKKGVVTPEDEIATVTRRNTSTGWDDETGLNRHRYNHKNADEEPGLTPASGVAFSEAGRGKSAGSNGKDKNNKETKSNNGNSKGNNGNNGSDKGNKGGNGKNK